jgi:hypothetical protein
MKRIAPTRDIGRRLAAAWRLLIACLALARAFQPVLHAAGSPVDEAERAKSEEAALSLWPEAADPESIMGREMRRLIQEYEARKDPRLQQVSAPMWIASQAAANTERQRTVAESEQSAMRLYPELAVLDSPLNRLFRETHARYKEVKPEYFSDARWPVKLAQQCALQVDAQKAIGAVSPNEGRERPSESAATPAQVEETSDPAGEKHEAIRSWIVNGILLALGGVLLTLIIRRGLRARKHVEVEQDGSAI